MRISDWSSDVCSSDLALDGVFAFKNLHDHRAGDHEADEIIEERAFLVDRIEALGLFLGHLDAPGCDDAQARFLQHLGHSTSRSEERRVGKECVSTCKSRWSP